MERRTQRRAPHDSTAALDEKGKKSRAKKGSYAPVAEVKVRLGLGALDGPHGRREVQQVGRLRAGGGRGAAAAAWQRARNARAGAAGADTRRRNAPSAPCTAAPTCTSPRRTAKSPRSASPARLPQSPSRCRTRLRGAGRRGRGREAWGYITDGAAGGNGGDGARSMRAGRRRGALAAAAAGGSCGQRAAAAGSAPRSRQAAAPLSLAR